MSEIVTYSPAYTLVPTYECFNRCSYCNFRQEPKQNPWLALATAEKKLKSLQSSGVREILILSGEVHPLSNLREEWFRRIYDLCELALSWGFLPHTNAGILSFSEMAELKQVNVSMGLMVEQTSLHLLTNVHKYAPSKVPELRLQQLAWAGELEIPFTTGLLLGIGETEVDWWESLMVIGEHQQYWGNIQEVILQPYSPGKQERFNIPAFNVNKLPKIVDKAREILPESIAIQIPPNLVVEPQLLLDCLAAGARDLGGIVPKDEVNPDYAHLDLEKLREILARGDWELVPRLPVYPQYVDRLPERLREVARWGVRGKANYLTREIGSSAINLPIASL
jgi:7,8-didemethyl-8-hydroxy-5-deazariboflavin synthase